MADGLSIPAIAARQQAIEGELQSVPAKIKEADESMLVLEKNLLKAKAKAQLQIASEGKMLAAERELRIFELTEEEWTEHRVAEIAAEYERNRFRTLDKESTSLASRMKAAIRSDDMHAAYGRG